MRRLLAISFTLLYLSVSAGAALTVPNCAGNLGTWRLLQEGSATCEKCGLEKSTGGYGEDSCSDKSGQQIIHECQRISQKSIKHKRWQALQHFKAHRNIALHRACAICGAFPVVDWQRRLSRPLHIANCVFRI